MGIAPDFGCQIVDQLSMFDRGVRQLADKANRNLFPGRPGNGKTDRIPIAALRKMRAGGCITEVAEFPYVIGGCNSVLSRSAAVSAPSRSQRQTRGVRPGSVIQNFLRHKKWASQVGLSENSHCSAGHD